MSKEFEKDALSIVVIQDEAAMELEPNVWCPIVKLAAHDKIKGWVMVGDGLQLPPTVFSATGKPKYNKHKPTLRSALFTCLRRQGFPTAELLEQSRMHEALARFPAHTIYGIKLRNGPNTNGRLEPKLGAFLKSYLEVERDDNMDSRKRLSL